MDEKELLEIYHRRLKDRKPLAKRWRGSQGPRPMSELLQGLFKNDPQALRKMEENRAITAWPSYVGSAAAKVSSAEKVSDHTLMVWVSDPLWRQQLIFLKNRILKKYATDFPRLGLKDIFFSAFKRPVFPQKSK